MKKSYYILLLSLLFTVYGCMQEKHENIEQITVEEMQTLLEMGEVQLVDVRTPDEYVEGYIHGAQNVDYNSPTFNEDILKLDKTKPVILYCLSGGRSAKCSKKMVDAGFVKVYDLDGGISAWKHEGLEVRIAR